MHVDDGGCPSLPSTLRSAHRSRDRTPSADRLGRDQIGIDLVGSGVAHDRGLGLRTSFASTLSSARFLHHQGLRRSPRAGLRRLRDESPQGLGDARRDRSPQVGWLPARRVHGHCATQLWAFYTYRRVPTTHETRSGATHAVNAVRHDGARAAPDCRPPLRPTSALRISENGTVSPSVDPGMTTSLWA
jgi:hypothetical protein